MGLKRLHVFCCIMAFIAGNPAQKETCQPCHNHRWSQPALPLPVISCCGFHRHPTEFSTMMNNNTHLNRNNARSVGYRGATINQRSNMTDSEQTSENECENSSPGPQNPQNQPTQ